MPIQIFIILNNYSFNIAPFPLKINIRISFKEKNIKFSNPLSAFMYVSLNCEEKENILS